MDGSPANPPRPTAALLVALAALLIPGAPALPAAGAGDQPRTDYLLHCMGCHLADGAGTPPGIPALRDRVGYYLQIPGGRDYLTQVPGAANAPLSDARLAAVLNWIVMEFAGESAPARWRRLSGEDVGRTRDQAPADIDARRHQLWREVEARFPAAAAAY